MPTTPAIPTGWPDVSLAHYLALASPTPPPAELLLTGLSSAQWASLDEADRAALSRQLLFVLDEQPLPQLLPTPGLYEVGRCAYGLYQLAQKQLAATPDAHPLAHGAYLYALYRVPLGTTPTPAEVEAAHAAVLAQPVTEVYADCLFLLASYGRALSGTLPAGPAQPGLLRLERPAVPTPGLLTKISQQLGRRGSRASLC